MKLVDIVGLHIEAASGTPLVLLREHDAPHRVLPIFIGAPEAAAIAVALIGQEPPRPLTHDLMATVIATLDGHVDAVEVTDLRDGSFLAEMALKGPTGECRVDARPSDCIALAVRLGTPLFVSDAVLDEAGVELTERPSDEEIDAAVAEFRNALEELDVSAFEEAMDIGEDDSITTDEDEAGTALGGDESGVSAEPNESSDGQGGQAHSEGSFHEDHGD